MWRLEEKKTFAKNFLLYFYEYSVSRYVFEILFLVLFASQSFYSVLLLFLRPAVTCLSFANIYISDLEYIHVSLRSAASSAACSKYLAFCKTQGKLDMLIFRFAVPIVEI